ncbi:hypothetical protein H2204_010806 [Knufia peltigerae]|uniref:Uncharacterized protein n=1 Tax=Knufia peltigerae TaxID=1002370 RepID=A0AA38XVG8_9EURO|nr:hypothetical protein H2204_010806 [Knufia peltigerae]
MGKRAAQREAQRASARCRKETGRPTLLAARTPHVKPSKVQADDVSPGAEPPCCEWPLYFSHDVSRRDHLSSQSLHNSQAQSKPPVQPPPSCSPNPRDRHDQQQQQHDNQSHPALIKQPLDHFNYHHPSPSCAAILENGHVRRIHHYAATTLWPAFGHQILSSNETLASAFFRLSMTDDLLLNSFIWPAALEMSLHCPASPENDAIMLTCQNRSLCRVRMHIENDTVNDSVIFAVLAFTISATNPGRVRNEIPRKRDEEEREGSCFGLFDPPLRSLGWLDYFSHFRWAEAHVSALRRLVFARGDLDVITTPGIAEQVQSTDILQASLGLKKPNFALCQLYRHVLLHQVSVVRPPRERASVFFPEGAGQDDDDDNEEIKDLLLDMKMYCRLLDTGSGNPATSSSSSSSSWETHVYRNLIQYRLLLLPESTGHTELCRLAILIFAYGVIYPLARPEPLKVLIGRLRRRLESDEARVSTCTSKRTEFLLWVAVMGAMGAGHSNADDEAFFISLVRTILMHLQIPSLVSLKAVMMEFLWLGPACDQGALELWTQTHH